jgi:hypothetical protein
MFTYCYVSSDLKYFVLCIYLVYDMLSQKVIMNNEYKRQYKFLVMKNLSMQIVYLFALYSYS